MLKADPLTAIESDTGNFPGGCTARGKVMQNISFPADFVTSCTGNNNAGAILLPDGESLLQIQPLYRAPATPPTLQADMPVVGWWHAGVPQQYPWVINITGDGALGAHGGSGLSSIGGTIRLGEMLRPGPIQHALKLELW